MVGILASFEFVVSRPDIGFGFLFIEGVSSIEEEPNVIILFFEVNIQHDGMILDIVLDSEGIGVDENVIVINSSY
jgi:hypothetical protein